MEEDMRKQGMLYLQQQRFGKRWKRVWCVLYRESSCSISRLEFFECKDGGSVEKNDKSLRKQLEHKKVIRLADCIRVSEVEMDGCPRDTLPFLIETTEKIYVFAADRQQLDDWTHRLCEVAFPMSWMENSTKRRSVQRGQQVDEEEGMEDNSLYSGRETVHDFRVCVRRTDAADRCNLKGECILRAEVDALHLIDKSRGVLLTWPYRYLRRFGRDKSTFSFEAGRRCDTGEGSFEFETKQGNFLFQAVEAAINLQRISLPQRQTSRGNQLSPDPPHDQNQNLVLPLPQPRSHVPQSPAVPAPDGLYSLVTEPMKQHKENSSTSQQQHHRTLLSRLEPPIDKTLMAVKSLTLDPRGGSAPRKNQVKMIPSCPLPQPGSNPGSSPQDQDHTYSQITLPTATDTGTRREKRGGVAPSGSSSLIPPEPEYSLPFDTIMADTLTVRQAPDATEPAADPLYDSIDEMQIRNILSDGGGPACRKVDHIYDEPEGCAAITQKPPTSVYDDPEEMRGDAWRIMGTTADPKAHEYPYNPLVDDYAVPKRPQRVLTISQNINKEEPGDAEEPHEEEQGGHMEEPQDSPYNNVTVKLM